DLKKVPEPYRPNAQKAAGSISKIAAAPAAPENSQSDTSDAVDGPPKVDIFITSWCPYCRRLEQFLSANRIRHTSYDIEKNTRGRREYIALGGDGSVPVIRIGTKVFHGFDEATLREELKIK